MTAVKKTYTNKTRKAFTVGFLIVFMAGFALSSGMYSSLLPDIIQHYRLSLTSASLLDTTSEIGMVGAMFIAMFCLDRLDKHWVITIAVMVYAVAMILIGTAPLFVVLLLFKVVMGISGSIIDNLCATYTSDLYGDERERYVSFLHMFFAIGSMLGPGTAVLLMRRFGGFGGSYICYGFFFLALSAVFLVGTLILKKPTPIVQNLDSEGHHKSIPFRKILVNRNMLWLGIGAAFLAGTNYINMWTPTFLQTVYPDRFDAAFCSLVVSLAYLGMIISRLLFSLLSKWLTSEKYMCLSCILSAAVIFVMVMLPYRWSWAAGMLLFGIFSGAQYTAKFLMAFKEFPEYAATVAALMAITSSCGNILLRFTINSIVDKGHYSTAILLAAMTTCIAFFIFRFGYKAPQKTD